ncbi:MAG: UdgX family uracil-DNA binding protein [Luteolibacter sp.]
MDFAGWRELARALVAEGVPPQEVLWETSAGQVGLFAEEPAAYGSKRGDFKVPAEFVKLARAVACHADPSRWALLYRLLWRLVRGGENHLLRIASDPDVAVAERMAKNVRREIHKMHAFVRFRKVEGDWERERYVAWFEPEHAVMEAAAPFFRDRFANMDWSIFTPKGCAHWNGETLGFSPGVAHDPSDQPDALEEIWRTYYRSIFNPARLKPRMMKSEMPVRYWKNLPEADLISGLIRDSRHRVGGMLEEPGREVRELRHHSYIQELRELSQPHGDGKPPDHDVPLDELAKMVQACRACPLWERATCAVAGQGPPDARLMIVGEQPGDQEDLTGKPFIGPAGQLLDRALAAAGVDRGTAYVTNAVKHFKWESRGKHRLHKNPDRNEIEACRPWLLAELSKVAPDVLILLGATAAHSLLGPGVKVTKQRGLIEAPHLARRVVLTVHPSYLLRLPDKAEQAAEFERFVTDLQLANP